MQKSRLLMHSGQNVHFFDISKDVLFYSDVFFALDLHYLGRRRDVIFARDSYLSTTVATFLGLFWALMIL